MRVPGHRAKPGVNSQSIDNGQYIDCSCGGYVGPICRTKEEARQKFEEEHLARVNRP